MYRERETAFLYCIHPAVKFHIVCSRRGVFLFS